LGKDGYKQWWREDNEKSFNQNAKEPFPVPRQHYMDNDLLFLLFTIALDM
jgi:hypothetical protein